MYFNKESDNHTLNAWFVRYWVEIPQRALRVVCQENHTIFTIV